MVVCLLCLSLLYLFLFVNGKMFFFVIVDIVGLWFFFFSRFIVFVKFIVVKLIFVDG